MRGEKEEELDEFLQTLIDMEIVVDCYDEYEVASSWHIYLSEALEMPFEVIHLKGAPACGLKNGEVGEVVELEECDACRGEIMVGVRVGDEEMFSAPLECLLALDPGDKRGHAMEAWRYWLNGGQGHEAWAEEE